MSDNISKKTKTLKTCEIMQYFKFMPSDLQDIKSIYELALSLTNLNTICINLHDKDNDSDGNLIEPHFHMVLTFNEGKTISSIAKVFSIENQYVNKIKTTTACAQEYLIHLNNPEKFQYAPDLVLANFDYVAAISKKTKKSKKENFKKDLAEKIANGVIREFNIFEYVNVFDYAQNKTFIKSCFEYRQKSIECCNRELQCVFITGESGCGKTTYAKEFARKKGYSIYVSSSGSNPFDDYKGQDCIILDDIRSSSFCLSDLLKITDTHTSSNVACRFYNKCLNECKLVIVTSIISIYDFYSNIQKENKESHIQLYRRFPLMIDIHKENIDLFIFNNSISKYEKQCSLPNIITKKYHSITCDLAADFVNSFGLTESDVNIDFDF